MSDRTTIYLKDLTTGAPVEASLIDGVKIREIVLTESYWKPLIAAKEQQLLRDKVPREKWPAPVRVREWQVRTKLAAVKTTRTILATARKLLTNGNDPH
jgi:hypothetical protein